MSWIWWILIGLLATAGLVIGFLLWLLKNNIYTTKQIKELLKNKKK